MPCNVVYAGEKVLEDTTMTEISLSNSAAVHEANADSTAGEVAKIRSQALATETTARIEIAKADDAAKHAAGNDAFSVIASAAVEAVLPGAKSVITGGEFVAARAEDKNTVTEVSPVAPVAIDESIRESTTRAPGLYSASVAPSVYGGNPKTSTDLSGNVAQRANVASMSLVQPTDGAGLFQREKVKPFEGMQCQTTEKTLEAAQSAKKLVLGNEIGNEIASERALESTKVWEKTHGAAMGMAMGASVAPSVAMKLAPRDIAGLVNEVRSDQQGAV